MPPQETSIRIAQRSDATRIRDFITNHWKKDHIFSRNESFFLHEYSNESRLNFVVAEKNGSDVVGILGFIPYDKEFNGNDAFLAIWKVNPGSGEAGLGIRLLQFLIDTMNFRSVSCVGVNPPTIPIYEYLGYTTGEMEHYYILNDRRNSFEIAVNARNAQAKVVNDAGFRLVSLAEKELVLNTYLGLLPEILNPPVKSAWYFKKRFLDHPIYQYQFYAIMVGDKVRCLLVLRKVRMNGSDIYRMIDVLGNRSALQHVAGDLRGLLHATGAEYLDLYQRGMPADILLKAGFTKKETASDTIIPDYFNPFVSKNIPIYYFTTLENGYVFFKGDGDQDRPS